MSPRSAVVPLFPVGDGAPESLTKFLGVIVLVAKPVEGRLGGKHLGDSVERGVGRTGRELPVNDRLDLHGRLVARQDDVVKAHVGVHGDDEDGLDGGGYYIVVQASFDKLSDTTQELFLIFLDALLLFESDKGGSDICPQVLAHRSKRAPKAMVAIGPNREDAHLTINCRIGKKVANQVLVPGAGFASRLGTQGPFSAPR